MAALGSLMANYTDSEEEEDEDEEDKKETWSNLIKEPLCKVSDSIVSTPKKRQKLVSYVNNEEEECIDNEKVDERNEDKNECVPMDLESPVNESSFDELEKEKKKKKGRGLFVETWTEGVSLPPEVNENCSPDLQEKINKLFHRKITSGYDMNFVIQNKKAFRNPSIYEKLIQFCEIDEHGSNFPVELSDAHRFGDEFTYTELAKIQKQNMENRETLSKKEISNATLKRGSKDTDIGGLKRKSKWDIVGLTNTSALPPVVKPAPILVSASASSSTHFKTIPAFGSLKKHT